MSQLLERRRMGLMERPLTLEPASSVIVLSHCPSCVFDYALHVFMLLVSSWRNLASAIEELVGI